MPEILIGLILEQQRAKIKYAGLMSLWPSRQPSYRAPDEARKPGYWPNARVMAMAMAEPSAACLVKLPISTPAADDAHRR